MIVPIKCETLTIALELIVVFVPLRGEKTQGLNFGYLAWVYLMVYGCCFKIRPWKKLKIKMQFKIDDSSVQRPAGFPKLLRNISRTWSYLSNLNNGPGRQKCLLRQQYVRLDFLD